MKGIRRCIFSGLLLIIFLPACQQVSDNASHTHPPPGKAITYWTDASEVFFEHPAMIAGGEKKAWTVHVTRLEDFKPISEGIVTLAFRSPDGTVFTTRTESPAFPGIFAPAPQLPAPGRYDLIIDIDGPQLTDRIRAGTIDVFASEDDVPEAPEKPAEIISFLKEQQWPISFSTTKTSRMKIAPSTQLSAELVEAAGYVASVTSPVSGLIQAQGNMKAPAPGDRVKTGRVLLTLAPTSQDNAYTRARAEEERLSREVSRLTRLFDAGAIAEKRLIEALHDLEISQATLEAMQAPDSGYNFPIKSPINGVVQEQLFTPGDLVDLGQPLYRIADPSYLWLKVHLPARYATQANSLKEAYFTVEGSERVYGTQGVVSIGNSVDAANRTIPVIMGVENPDESLKIGLRAQAHLSEGEAEDGLAIPTHSILIEDGLPVAYIQIGGESFERRLLTLGPSDGSYTLISAGIQENERIVTQGAYQVYLASLNTSEISDHGHPH